MQKTKAEAEALKEKNKRKVFKNHFKLKRDSQ